MGKIYSKGGFSRGRRHGGGFDDQKRSRFQPGTRAADPNAGRRWSVATGVSFTTHASGTLGSMSAHGTGTGGTMNRMSSATGGGMEPDV